MTALNATVERGRPGRSAQRSPFPDEGDVADQDGSYLAFEQGKTGESFRAILDQMAKDITSDIADEARPWAPTTIVIGLTPVPPGLINSESVVKWPLKRPVSALLEFATKSGRMQLTPEPTSCVFIRADETPAIWGLAANQSASPIQPVVVSDQGKWYEVKMYYSIGPIATNAGC